VRIVIDTNVFISGVFFSGVPARVLDACFLGRCELAVSPQILQEYARVGSEFSKRRRNVDLDHFLSLILSTSALVQDTKGVGEICSDPDDDKFIHCALAAEASHIISGDKHLLDMSGYGGVQVIRPRAFVDKYLKPKG
jgi:putative PIN family toxin of toxin-antitoxin system